jgi:hypothetical protein
MTIDLECIGPSAAILLAVFLAAYLLSRIDRKRDVRRMHRARKE